ncbi:MAG: PA0069 family radical SAM protein [Calditrichaeota bacterium]|nr:MAG: PA0069 family radical SAM protein [Calditrichota bacterium]
MSRSSHNHRPGRRGRASAINPPNRFEKLAYIPEEDPEAAAPDGPSVPTEYYRDSSRSLIVYNDSPDVGFRAGINPYRGCEHGCIYCYARPTHEYLGLSCGLDFETKIFVKEDAPELLRKELASKRWKPRPLAISGATDAYQPVERRLQLTRRCLEVLVEFRNPVGIVTKNALVTRDIDLLQELARHRAAAVILTITTLQGELVRKMEPRTSQPLRRLQALRELTAAGIPTGVMIAPVIPGLTDHEIPAIIEQAVQAGAGFAAYVMLRLPHQVKSLFIDWLERHFPDRKEKVLQRLRAIRGGKLNESAFGKRMRGEGVFADQIDQLFKTACRKYGMGLRGPRLSTAAFRRPSERQLTLF